MAKSDKLDLYKEHKAEYAASAKAPALVKVGPAKYLAITGRGEPDGQEFQDRIGAMYAMAFTIKMTRKFAGLGDYKVCHLEGQWWHETAGAEFFRQPRDTWSWRLLIRVPDFIKKKDLVSAQKTLIDKGKSPLAGEVTLETLREGLCVQMLHMGPYAEEPRTLGRMCELAEAEGLAVDGLHHEIYLSDPRRVPPERLKTILRLPLRKP